MTAATALLCESIETLSMAYLDNELADEERRELELHLPICLGCRQVVQDDRALLLQMQTALIAAPASELFKAKLQRQLDSVDQVAVTQARLAAKSKWQRILLPSSAIAAAAAALLFFAVSQPAEPRDGALAKDAVRQQLRPAPMEVSGPATTPWLQEHFEPNVQPPSFSSTVMLQGARLTSMGGRDAAQLTYDIKGNRGERVALTAFVVKGVLDTDLPPGQDFQAGTQVLRLTNVGGYPSIWVREGEMAFVFLSPQLSSAGLMDIVVTADLVRRAQAGE
jgi:anti-sigma factor RsiW